MDHVLGNKAVFKKATDTAGDAAILSGAVLGTSGTGMPSWPAWPWSRWSGQQNSFPPAPRLKRTSAMWDNLPLYLSFVAWNWHLGSTDSRVEFHDGTGRVLPGLPR